ncbi:MAG: cation:proton antiporter [Chloroflexota bacterium]
MSELGVVVDLVSAAVAALLGGMIALRLHQPVILGYLLAGVAIGPYTPGPVGDTHNVQLMAELGVAFLMFALGVEFSLSELLKLRWVATVGGVVQIAATVLLGVAISPLLGLDLTQGLFLGSVIALSSTMVSLKLLMGRGELESLHGRIVLGILIVQDLSVVPMMVILPALAGPADGLVLALAVAAAKAAAILVGALYLGTRIAPLLLSRVAATGSREMFLLAIVSLALGTALVTYALGLSIAFGAFLAGLILSESEFSHQALAEALPLRDIFSAIFFVSVGMLIDPLFLLQNAPAILLVTAAVVVGKLVIATAVPLLFRYPGRAALGTGLFLAQIGEFSFVLTRLGQDRGVTDDYFSSLILSSALLSILINPLLVHEGRQLHRLLTRVPLVGRLFWERFEAPSKGQEMQLRDHVVICGYGRVGREMARALESRGEPYLVVELDPYVVKELRRSRVNYIYGDAANPAVLAHTQLSRARLVAATVPDAVSVEMAVRNARALNPSVPIIARIHSVQDMQRILNAGADEAVCPEFEAGMEFVRHAIARFGASEDEVSDFVRQRRTERRRDRPDDQGRDTAPEPSI